MKRGITFLICIMFCISLCACMGKTSGSYVNSSGVSYEEQTSSEAEASGKQSSDPKDTSSKPKTETTSKNMTSKNTSSKKNTINNERPIDNWLTPNPWPNTSSKVSTSSKASTSSTREEEYVLGVDYGAFAYEGIFVEMVSDNDIVYLICKKPNTLTVYDSNKFTIKNYYQLPGEPAEIHIEGEEIQISFPNLKRINIYNKNTFEEVKSIPLPNIVSSFCIDGDLVYYGEHDQHCRAYRTNIVTGETVTIPGYSNAVGSFYYPELRLNKEKGILYIGESGSTGSSLFYYNTSDLTCLYRFSEDGIPNSSRTLFLVDDKLYWGPMEFDAVNPRNPGYQYGNTDSWARMMYVDEKYVIYAWAVHDRKTHKYITAAYDSGYMLMTESDNLVYSYHPDEGNFIFSLPKKIYTKK